MNGADTLGAELAAQGKVVLLETRGRVSGSPVLTAVGFVEDVDGSLLVAAGTDWADWAMNLRATPRTTATIGERIGDYDAVELSEDERNAAVVALILKYGTPAERLGRGPAFRLTPAGLPADD